MSPRIVDKKVKKQDILEASIRVFARHGIANTKMIDIANEASIGKGTIYEYFRSKEEIIKEAFSNFMSRLDAAGTYQLDKISDPVDKLSHIVDGWMNILADSYEESKVLIDFWSQSTRFEKVTEVLDLNKILNDYRSFMADIIEQGISGGTIRPLDSKLMASVIIGALDGLALHWIISRAFFDLKKVVDLFKKTTIESLRKE